MYTYVYVLCMYMFTLCVCTYNVYDMRCIELDLIILLNYTIYAYMFTIYRTYHIVVVLINI